MPQNLMTNQTTSEPVGNESIQEPAAVDAYADRLMDELFTDVEDLLESDAQFPTEPVRPEFVSLNSIKVPQIVLPASMVPQPESPTPERDKEAQRLAALRAQKKATKQFFDRLLLGTAFVSLLITFGLWLATRGGLGRLIGPIPVVEPSTPPVNAKAAASTQFVDYVQHSLKQIDQKATTQKQSNLPGVPGTPPASNLPTVAVPGSVPPNGSVAQALNRMANIMEAQASKPPAAAPPAQVVVLPPPVAAASSTTPAAQPPATTTAVSIPQPQSAPKSAVEGTSAASSQTASAATSGPESPETTSESSASNETKTAAATSGSEASPAALTHTLVGTLELGERSAALFEVNGVARRIYIGESIGASGWTLVEIANQEAVIRRNGEVRSIFVGQGF